MSNAQKYPENSITVYKGSYYGYVRIYSNSKWFKGVEYCVLDDLGGCLVIKKCYIDVPDSAVKIGAKTVIQFPSEMPHGNYPIALDESDEDELVIYYS